MDICSHAIAGVAVGTAYGRPLTGLVFGILPDLVLGLERLSDPPHRYRLTHSLTFVVLVGVAAGTWLSSPVPLLALWSHILLDIPTHGDKWEPRLLYPFSDVYFGGGEEWEWFNKTWWTGFALTLFWSILWFSVRLV